MQLSRCIIVIFLLTISLSLLVTGKSTNKDTIQYNAKLINTDIKRVIDIRTHIEEVTTTVKLSNEGKDDINYYLVTIPSEKLSQLSFVEGTKGSGRTEEKLLTTAINNIDSIQGIDDIYVPEGTGWFKLNLNQPLNPGKDVTFNVVSTFTRTLHPLPKEILQDQNQLVTYNDSAYFYTPYNTVKQTTLIKLTSTTVETYTKKSSTQRGDEIEYGPYDNIEPFTKYNIMVHYENNSPFATATKMIKEIEISHWGNIAVTETYDLTHSGALLTGPFSRFDYQRQHNYAPAAYRSLNALLPHHARDIYYRDIIGNVSTSHVRRTSQLTHMEVEPRFPMFGGWKADFHIGYNLPIHHYLSVDSSNTNDYILNIPFGSMFQTIGIDQAVIRVILPEGATDIEYLTEFELDSAEFETHLTHLDTYGRPVLVLSKANLVKHHNQLFQLKYHFPKFYILHEPALLISVFALFLVATMAYYRIQLGITTDNDNSNTNKSGNYNRSNATLHQTSRSGEVASSINQLVKQLSTLEKAYEQRDEETIKKNESNFNEIKSSISELSRLDSELTNLAKELEDSLNKLRAEARKYARAEQKELIDARKSFAQAQDNINKLIKQL